MSMNITISGTREIEVLKTGKREEQTIFFNVWQTPTKATNIIMQADDRIQAYIDWTMDGQVTQQVPVYAEDDVFGDGDPIGYEDFNYGEDHVADLKEWIRQAEENGYEVEVSYM